VARQAKALLDRIAAMLTTLGQRGYAVHDTPNRHGVDRIDTDSDSDPDTDGGKEPKDRHTAICPTGALQSPARRSMMGRVGSEAGTMRGL